MMLAPSRTSREHSLLFLLCEESCVCVCVFSDGFLVFGQLIILDGRHSFLFLFSYIFLAFKIVSE